MKVIDLGRGLKGIQFEPDKVWAESIRSVNRGRLKRAGLCDEDIERIINHVKRTYKVDPDKMD